MCTFVRLKVGASNRPGSTTILPRVLGCALGYTEDSAAVYVLPLPVSFGLVQRICRDRAPRALPNK